MHTMHLFFTKGIVERLSNDMQSSSKMVNIGLLMQPLELEMQWTKGKTTIISCDILSGGRITCTTSDKLPIS